MTAPTITERLAHALYASAAADIPAAVSHEAERAPVDWMGAALGGCGNDSVRCALTTFAELAAPGQATVIRTRKSRC